MRTLAQRGIPQAVLPPHERPAMQALRALGFAGTDARGARARRPRCASGTLRVQFGRGDVGGQRGDGQRVGRHGGRARPFHAGQPARPLPSLARSADHLPDPARDIQRRRAFRRARPVARGAAVRRRGRRQSHACSQAATASRCRLLRVRPQADLRAARLPRGSLPGRPTRPPLRWRAGIGSTPRGPCTRSSIQRRSTPACFTTMSSPSGTATSCFCHERAFVDQHAVLAELADAGGACVCAAGRARFRGEPARRRIDLPVQQPARHAAHRRDAAGGAARKSARTSASPRGSTRW